MKVDKRLNLTFDINDEHGALIHVHSTPVPYPVFKKFFMVASKAFSAMYQEGLSITGGPRVAGMVIRQVAEFMGQEMAKEVENGFMAEIHRLTNVLVPMPHGGYDMMPLQDAYKAGLISEEDFDESEGQVTFFTLASHMHKRSTLLPILEQTADMWGQRITSLNVTEYMTSLKTSTEAANTGATTHAQVQQQSVAY